MMERAWEEDTPSQPESSWEDDKDRVEGEVTPSPHSVTPQNSKFGM
jgi:hypothetical protein